MGAPAHTYGTLGYNRKAKCWVIKGEPCVTELAKRLFPGCEGRGRGEARFTAHRRIIGELNWLMLRYPLEVRQSDRERWEEALCEARDYAAWREARLAMPESATPPEDRFAGIDGLPKGPGLFAGQPALAAGRRNGPGQDGAGPFPVGDHRALSRHHRGAAPPCAQLAAGDRPLFEVGRRRSRPCDSRPDAL